MGNGDFGGRVAGRSEDEEDHTGGLPRGVREKNREEKPGGGAHNDQGEEEQDQPQENVGSAQFGKRFLLQKLVLRLGEEAFASPVCQKFAGAQSFFAGCAVDPHACLPKRRPIWTSTTSIAIPVTTK